MTNPKNSEVFESYNFIYFICEQILLVTTATK